MPINPDSSPININNGVSNYPVFINDIKVTQVDEPFDRLEFNYNRLAAAPNAIGQTAMRTTLLGNTPAQIIIGGAFTYPLILKPNVTVSGSNFPNFKKKFVITRIRNTRSGKRPELCSRYCSYLC